LSSRRRSELPEKIPAQDRHLAAEIGALLARSRRHVFQRVKRKLEAAGESIFVWRLLAYLHDDGPSIQAELADATAQHPASISRLLDEIEEEGLVRRTRDGEDRRRVVVELTAAGKQRYLASLDVVVEGMQESLRILSVDEQRQLGALLGKIIAAAK
jgi:DNA-binding MarR family transcriptional regulator